MAKIKCLLSGAATSNEEIIRMKKKKVVYSIILLMLVMTGCTIGGSFYMLNFSLVPDAKILSKDADTYPYMYDNYPFLRPWIDSLK